MEHRDVRCNGWPSCGCDTVETCEPRLARLRRALAVAEEALEAGRDDRWCRNCASTWEEHKHWCSVGNALDEIRKAKEG